MLFSPDGGMVTCAAQLTRWPSMESIAELQGVPIGWGALDDVELLLLRESSGAFATLDGAGNRHSVDTADLEGRIVASWSPGRDAIWLQSGVQTPDLRLDAWSPENRRLLAALPNTIQATNVTASPSEQWAAIWGGGCAVSQQGTGCGLTVAVAQAGAEIATPIVANLEGLLATAWVADDGTAMFTAAGQNGRVDLWRAPPGAAAEIWFQDVAVSPLADGQLAVTSAEVAAVVNLADATDTPLSLPEGVAPGDVLSLSPDLRWLAYGSSDARVSFRQLQEASAETDLPLPSLSGVGILWPGDDEFAAVFVGPPPTTIVVRLID
jgi:hypothetical protein